MTVTTIIETNPIVILWLIHPDEKKRKREGLF